MQLIPEPTREMLRNFFRFTLAAYAALFVGVSLLAVAIIAWIAYDSDPHLVALSDYFHWPQLVMLAGLWLVTCLLTYWTVRLWNEDLPAGDDRLEEAWHSGLRALRQRNMAIDQLPVFLVLGCSDFETQQRMVQSSGARLVADAIPENPTAPLRWFLCTDRILLFCHGAGVLGLTQARLNFARQHAPGESLQLVSTSRWQPLPQQQSAQTITSQRPASVPNAVRADAQPQASRQGGRDTVGQALSANSETATMDAATRETETLAPFADRLPESTIAAEYASSFQRLEAAEELLAEFGNSVNFASETVVPPPPPAMEPSRSVGLMTSSEQVEHQQKLSDFCRRLRATRGPVAPINGILVCAEASKLAESDGWTHAWGQAIRQDLAQLQEQMGMQAPVSFLIHNMQQVPGFAELVRRLGPELSQQQSLGIAFQLTRAPNPQGVAYACQQVVRALGSLVYQRMHGPHGELQPGNAKLFRLLIHARSKLHQRLTELLVESVAGDGQTHTESALFSGLYLSGTGDQVLERGFTGAAFNHLMAQQENLNWTSSSRRMQTRLKVVLAALIGSSAVSAIVAVFQLILLSLG